MSFGLDNTHSSRNDQKSVSRQAGQQRRIEGALADMRLRLLDLTARNRLIHFSPDRQGGLRIVDALQDPLVEALLAEVELSFAAVPEPDEAQLLDTGYLVQDGESGEIRRLRDAPDAPAARRVQTLHYPRELEARLNTLAQKAESAIQETGANILYLALGFLEWYESKAPDTPRLAPLFLLPVRLLKGRLNARTFTYEYRLAWPGEEVMANLSLREKLRVDFGLALPDLDEEMAPEAYLARVQLTLAAGIRSSRSPGGPPTDSVIHGVNWNPLSANCIG